jgi:hypothetical protein
MVVEDWSKLGVMQDHTANHDAERLASTSRLTEASRDQAANQRLGETNRETRRLGQRHTVKEAADVLGITVDAVRGRIRRGTLDSVKLDGVVYVLLDTTNREQQSDESATESADASRQTADESGLVSDQSELVGDLRGQVDWLRREVERKDTIIMQMAQRIPELEAPPEPRDANETASKDVSGGDHQIPPSNMEEPRDSWWKRFFGFDARGTG